MSLRLMELGPIPEETARVAHAAFPKGNLFMRMRDELGAIYQDEMFAGLYSKVGQPAEAPWRLALVSIMQFAEGLADRQAADAVRSRIDWKYALGLELSDPGFDFSVLSEFRTRLIAGGMEHRLLETMLERFMARGLVKARGQQRTDSTHVLAAIRTLGRLENIGETLRAALNSVARVAPDWLAGLINVDWFERYGRRVEDYRLPTSANKIRALAEIIGADGHKLLAALYAPTAPAGLRDLEAVEILRITWIQQFYYRDGTVTWRKPADLPPPSVRLDSPYDRDAHRGNKRSVTWTGYKRDRLRARAALQRAHDELERKVENGPGPCAPPRTSLCMPASWRSSGSSPPAWPTNSTSPWLPCAPCRTTRSSSCSAENWRPPRATSTASANWWTAWGC